MNTQAIDQAITELSGEIALRQNAIQSLQALKNGQGLATEPQRPPRQTKSGTPRKAGRKPAPVGKGTPGGKPVPPTPPPARSTAATLAAIDKLDKPDSIGGAMKYVIRQQPKATFTAESLKTRMAADADFAKLLAEYADKAPSQHPVVGNLNYWSSQGKIKGGPDGYVVNPEHNAFFGIA